MFDEIRYKLNSVEIDLNKNVEITSTIKNYISLMYEKSLIALNVGWNTRSGTEEEHFNFCIPLNMLLGFCEDYKRMVKVRYKLILIRSLNNNNCLIGDPAIKPDD